MYIIKSNKTNFILQVFVKFLTNITKTTHYLDTLRYIIQIFECFIKIHYNASWFTNMQLSSQMLSLLFLQ